MPDMRFWLTHPFKSEEWTGVRGQRDHDLYDISQDKDTGDWIAYFWLTLKSDPDAIAHKEIARGSLFDCMKAVEADSQRLADLPDEDDPDDWPY